PRISGEARFSWLRAAIPTIFASAIFFPHFFFGEVFPVHGLRISDGRENLKNQPNYQQEDKLSQRDSHVLKIAHKKGS
ncbi:hypothetical protein, partial [Herbaspirillum sp. alder98]|uniref:hypothetical protein n=1 Tax=Herbaspirillum sp. alder98 TaxID=2913096 RepID=UPI001CD87DEA